MNNVFNNKRKKFNEDIKLIQKDSLKRKPFYLEISSKQGNEGAIGFTYDVALHNPDNSENGTLSLEGKWACGLSKFSLSNQIISFKKIETNSIALLYLVLKMKKSGSFAVPISFFPNRLFKRTECVNYANKCLSDMWLHICEPNLYGLNIVGIYFATCIFCFFENTINDYVYIKQIGNEEGLNIKIWEIFVKIFDKFKKEKYLEDTLENIEIYCSDELVTFLGGFIIPDEIENYLSEKDFHERYLGVTISKRIGCIPFPNKISSNLDIRANDLKPLLLPLNLNILTNILSESKLRVVKFADHTFRRFRLLATVPLNDLNSNIAAINYFPPEVVYKELPTDSKITKIQIYITDTFNERLISLNSGDAFLTLDFLPK